jgi:hypothetical protein
LTLDGANVLNNMGAPLVLPFSPEKLEDITKEDAEDLIKRKSK